MTGTLPVGGRIVITEVEQGGAGAADDSLAVKQTSLCIVAVVFRDLISPVRTHFQLRDLAGGVVDNVRRMRLAFNVNPLSRLTSKS